MKRRTYTERRSYSAKVMRFRQAVYAPRTRALTAMEQASPKWRGKLEEELTNGCRLLLMRLSDDMDAQGHVSVPRSQLADELGVAPARITEWMAMAVRFDFLDKVVRGRPGTTAVYGCKVPVEVRQGVPSQRYARADHVGVRQGVPSEPVKRYARAVPPEVGTDRTSSAAPERDAGCRWHQHESCTPDCADYDRRRTA